LLYAKYAGEQVQCIHLPYIGELPKNWTGWLETEELEVAEVWSGPHRPAVVNKVGPRVQFKFSCRNKPHEYS